MFTSALCMELVTDIATTAVATKLINVVRSGRKGPLVGMDTGTAHVADLGLRQFHLLLRTGRVLLLREVILAQTPMAIRATSKRFFVTFMAAGRLRCTATPRL